VQSVSKTRSAIPLGRLLINVGADFLVELKTHLASSPWPFHFAKNRFVRLHLHYVCYRR
jgi:hypothetical protein